MRVKSLVSAINFILGGRKPLSGPIKVHWDLEYRCNSRCLNCVRWKLDAPSDQLDTDTALKLISEIAALGTDTLSFAGNEPMLREDIFILIERAKKEGLKVSLNTNGLSLCEERIKKLAALGTDMIYFSLDGPNAEIHDRIRGVPGGFERIISAKNVLRRFSGKISIMANTVANRINIPYLYDTVKIVKEEGFDGIMIQPVHEVKEFFQTEGGTSVREEDIPAMKEQIERILKEYGEMIPLPPTYLKEFGTFYRSPSELYKYRCTAGYMTMDIRQNGEIVPCPVGFDTAGIYKPGNMKGLWYGAEFNRIRKNIKNRNHPVCWFACIIPINIMFYRIRRFSFGEVFSGNLFKHILKKLR